MLNIAVSVRRVLYILLAMCAPGCAEKQAVDSHGSLTAMDVLDDQCRLHPGDGVTVRIDANTSAEEFQIVSAAGKIRHSNIGLVNAGGLTCRQLASELKAMLERKFSHKVSVLVMRTHYHPVSPKTSYSSNTASPAP